MENTLLLFTRSDWTFTEGKRVKLLFMYDDVVLTTHDKRVEPIVVDDVTRARLLKETEYIPMDDPDAFDIIVEVLRGQDVPTTLASMDTLRLNKWKGES